MNTNKPAKADKTQLILADATLAPLIISLPPAATVDNKFRICIKKIDETAHTVTIEDNTFKTIELNEATSLEEQKNEHK